jgi:hypothetical protein
MRKENELLKKSMGQVWLISDENDDPIQVMDCDEIEASKRCKKYGWSYRGISVFRDVEKAHNRNITPADYETLKNYNPITNEQ